MWNHLAALAAEPDVAVVAAGDGWTSVSGIVNGVRDNMMEIGLTILGILGIVVGITIGMAGKGKARESVEKIGIWLLGGLVVGLALFLPGVASKLGGDIGSGTGGGNSNVSVVDGQ